MRFFYFVKLFVTPKVETKSNAKTKKHRLEREKKYFILKSASSWKRNLKLLVISFLLSVPPVFFCRISN